MLILTKQSDKQANERVNIAIMMMARGGQNATITRQHAEKAIAPGLCIFGIDRNSLPTFFGVDGESRQDGGVRFCFTDCPCRHSISHIGPLPCHAGVSQTADPINIEKHSHRIAARPPRRNTTRICDVSEADGINNERDRGATHRTTQHPGYV